jgi:hypothetical protein
MTPEDSPPLMPAWLRRAVGWSVLYLVLVAACFNFPLMPGSGLDPSWRMALGYFFDRGLQFGKDVVFTYGPLGFIMSKTFSGIQFWSLIAGQLTLAIISATVIIRQGSRLTGSPRLLYFGFFLLFGTSYEDALHMLVIAILGFELLRESGRGRFYLTALIGAVLAFYAQIKFTDFMLGTFVVLLACAYSLGLKRLREGACLLAAYVAAYLAIWLLCGQQLANLPAYFQASWSISQGYQWAMGFPSPISPLWKGLVILAGLVAYAAAHLKLNPDKPRAVANVALLLAFIYLNWKHGFVRADGHMIGFFFCAMLPMAAFPALLDDADRFRRLHRWVFATLIVLGMWGIENTLWGVTRGALGIVQAKVWSNVEWTLDWSATRQRYRDALSIERRGADLYQTREAVGQATIDVLGEEQNVLILNKLNYKPRPVIQSYSTFMPLLAQLNYDFYASDAAPDYVLAKIQTIDERLPTMDDSLALRLLVYRYEFLRTEKGFHLWKKNPGPFDAAKFEPKLVRAETIPLSQFIAIKPWATHPLWLKIDLKPSLLGSLRSFLYKPPQVRLNIADINGNFRSFLMPLPMGRTGFIVNPFIDDPSSFMEFAASRSTRLIGSVSVDIAPQDRKFFSDSFTYELSELPAPSSGGKYFASVYGSLFRMFKTYPLTYDAQNPVSEAQIDGRDVAILHAPSLMTFEMVKNAKKITGKFGFLPGAYSKGGRTNGAEFVVYWSNGGNRVDLFQKFLDPLPNEADRGLQAFEVPLNGLTGGRLYLQVKPGPYNDFSWDWTGWTDIEIK